MVRRLPVLQTKDPEDLASEQRPRTHWVAIAAGLTLSLWVPLLLVAFSIGRALATRIAGVADPAELGRAASSGSRGLVALALVLPAALSFALACFVAAALVGRFGRHPRDAVMGTLIAAGAAWGLAVFQGSLAPWPVAVATALALAVLALGFGALGTRFGVRRRHRG